MAENLFWLSIFLVLYAFLGYPGLVWFLARIRGFRPQSDQAYTPSVSMLLSIYNEERIIEDKINNFLQLDYPKDRLELVIVLDGCSDRTEEIVRSLDRERIRLLVQSERRGKTLALNQGAKEAAGEILVFTDANSMYAPAAVHKLVQPFAHQGVGLVSGRSVYLDDKSNQEQSGGLYRRYEDFIKEQESATVSIIGADGAIYAMRREIFQPLPAERINDLIHPIQVVRKGFRAVHEPGAVCTEAQDRDASGELSRQTRIMAQSWLIVLSQAGNLIRDGCLGHLWALISHKVLRWLTLPLMAVLLVSNLFLLTSGMFFQAALLGQAGFYLAAALGWRRTQGLLRVPAMFTLLHVAAILGLYQLAAGQVYTTWNPRKN